MMRTALVMAALLAAAGPVLAQGAPHVLVVSGASGGGEHAARFDGWRTGLVGVLRGRIGMDASRVTVLAEKPVAGEALASAENVRRALASYQASLAGEDTLIVVLIGHGTTDGASAKFNLVGPDLSAADWHELLRGVRATVAFINTTAASFPFIEELSGPERVVITATDSPAQRYQTMFAEFLIAGLDSDESDLDKNGRTSLLEAFTYASTRVGQHYEQLGQLATERPLLDDDGDGVGREAGADGPDGGLAGRTYFEAPAAAPTGADEALAALFKERARLESAIEALKAGKAALTPEAYAGQLEELLVQLARVSRDIRERSGP